MEKFTLFYMNCFSQWEKCRFVVEEIPYNCAEQYMMMEKARFFEDKETYNKIWKEKHPRDQIRLGRQVKNFDEDKWKLVARDIVYRGNHAKFTQNWNYKKILLATEGTTLVEASKVDQIWGIGRAEDDPLALDRSTWNGKNWLGEVLTKVRDDLAAGVKSETFNWK